MQIEEKVKKHLKNNLNEKIRHLPVKDRKLDKLFTDQEFYVLNKQNLSNSDYEDSVFKTNIEDLILQVAGDPSLLYYIVGIYATEDEAKNKYNELLDIMGYND